MNEIVLTDKLITFLLMLIFTLPFLFAIMIWENNEKKRCKRADKILKLRKKQFEKACELAGQRMMNADKNKAIIESNVPKKKQTIKYTGLFSGENAPKE